MKRPNIYPIPVILLTVTIILTAAFMILLPQVWYMGFIAGPLGTLFLAKLVCSVSELIRRKRLGIDLFAVLEKDRRAITLYSETIRSGISNTGRYFAPGINIKLITWLSIRRYM